MSQTPSRACPQCGMPLAANQRFCTRCGAVVDVLPGSIAAPMPGPGGQNGPQMTPPLPLSSAFTPPSPQVWGSQPAPSVPGTPSFSQAPSVPGTPSFSQPGHSSVFPAGQPAPQPSMPGPQQVQPAFPQQAQAPSMHGMQAPSSQAQMAAPQAHGGPFAGHPAQPAAFHAPSAPPAQPPPAPGSVPHALPGASTLHKAGKVAAGTVRRHGIRVLLTKPVIAAIAVVVLAGSAAGIAYSAYRASAPTSFVIGTDRGNNQIRAHRPGNTQYHHPPE